MGRTYTMSNYYRIKLTPVDKFFFGGDMTFQVAKNKEDEKNNFNHLYSSYIIQSNQFPQQTSLLGMLRFLILSNAGDNVFKDNKIINATEAAKLIGINGFSADGKNDFGAIKKITHVRILRNDDELEFAPLSGSINMGNPEQWANGTYNLGILSIPNVNKDQYNAKHGLEALMLPITCLDSYYETMRNWETIRKEILEETELPKPPYRLSDIFIPDRRVGIARNASTGKTSDGALFKQISYRFNNNEANHCFVFEAEVELENFEKYSGKMVNVGGDNSQFIIDINEIKEFKNAESKNYNNVAVLILSPTYLTREDVKNNTLFAVTRLMPFRFLREKNTISNSQNHQSKSSRKALFSLFIKKEDNKTNSQEEHNKEDGLTYHILNSKLERGERYELYAPGTVFYIGNDEKKRRNFINALESKNNFRLIGYNEYKLIEIS